VARAAAAACLDMNSWARDRVWQGLAGIELWWARAHPMRLFHA